VKWLVWLYRGWTCWLASGVAPQPVGDSSSLQPQTSSLLCQDCGGALSVVMILNADGRIICRVLPDHVTPYLDSG